MLYYDAATTASAKIRFDISEVTNSTFNPLKVNFIFHFSTVGTKIGYSVSKIYINIHIY